MHISITAKEMREVLMGKSILPGFNTVEISYIITSVNGD